ncbi:MAG: LLM class flavin-dependent oxidoreductase [Mycobacterium sp.]
MPAPLSFGIEIVGDGIGEHRPAALAARLEAAGVSYWVIGAGRDEPAASAASLDATVIATIAARHSTGLGLVIAAAAHRDHPYNLARRLLSVDHAAQGRVGWFALDADRRLALNASEDSWTGAALEARHTADAVAAVRALWRSWPLESVVGDVATGVFADIAQIRQADVHRGYTISGPMNVPGSVQGDLPVWQRAGGHSGGADLVVVEQDEPLPDSPAVVRVRSVRRLSGVLSEPFGVVGVLARVTTQELDTVLDELLPRARERKLVAAPSVGTLRHRLALTVPAEPDLSTNSLAFSGVPTPGGRL